MDASRQWNIRKARISSFLLLFPAVLDPRRTLLHHLFMDSSVQARQAKPSSPPVFSNCLRMWQRFQRLFLVYMLFGFGILTVVIAGPVRSAIEVGGDEPYEVTKGLLWAHGYLLYEEIWSDQPPLFTALLGILFRCFGPTIGVARTLSAAFGVLLLGVCFLVVKRHCGLFAAFVAATCLLVAPNVLELSVSVMQEVPMLATALGALWLPQRWERDRRWPWLVASGVVLAAAMQIKLLAVIAAPALVVEIVVVSRANGGASWVKRAARNLQTWGAGLASGFAVLGLSLGWNYDLIWAFHFSPELQAASSMAPQLRFPPHLLLEHPEALWGAVVGLIVMILRRDWRRLVFPVVMLLTAAAIHSWHRPWWYFYYLHFAVPLAWLTGYGVAEIFRTLVKSVESGFQPRLLTLGSYVAMAALITLLIGDGGTRLIFEIQRLRQLPRIEKSELVAKMKQFAGRTRWIYTQSTMYAFHAGLLVPPKLAVISRKRVWSGQITDIQILTVVKRYQPEQLLLSNEAFLTEMKVFIDIGYLLVYDDGRHQLYVAKALLPNDSSGKSRMMVNEGFREHAACALFACPKRHAH